MSDYLPAYTPILDEAEAALQQAEEFQSRFGSYWSATYGIAESPAQRAAPVRSRLTWCADCDAPRRGLWPCACTVCGRELEVAQIQFREPLHHDPDVVLAEFTLHPASNGQDVFGVIYADGSCSCSGHKSRGHCLHAAAWKVYGAWPDLLAIASRDAEVAR